MIAVWLSVESHELTCLMSCMGGGQRGVVGGGGGGGGGGVRQ